MQGSPAEPSATVPVELVGAGRLEALLHRLFPLGSVIDLRSGAAAGQEGPGQAHAVHLYRAALEDGSRPPFRWCEVVAWQAVDFHAPHPAASIWEIDVIPVIPADGAIQPGELGGCARTHRQALVRLTGQFVSAAPGQLANPVGEAATLQALLMQHGL